MNQDRDSPRSGSTPPVSLFPSTAPSAPVLVLHAIVVFSIAAAVRVVYSQTTANYGLLLGTTVVLYTLTFSVLKDWYD
ncbi:MAG: hypothetical protein ABEI52_09555 [Halobacteriaceae archaeon]